MTRADGLPRDAPINRRDACSTQRHQPSTQFIFNDAKNMVSFVDGHVSYIKIFLDSAPRKGLAIFYNPPASFDYQWTPD
ncbi:MAG: hypothetical protein ABIQ35_08200 [Verrucomicrobiota bacterium]